MKKYIYIVLTGLVFLLTAVCSFYSNLIISVVENYNIFPGIVFGVGLIVAFKLLKRKISIVNIVFIIIFSTAGYLAAHWVAFFTSFFATKQGLISAGDIAVASLVGYFVTVLPLFFIKNYDIRRIRILFGMLLAALIGFGNVMAQQIGLVSPNEYLPFDLRVLFLSWQIIIGLYLSFFIFKPQTQINQPELVNSATLPVTSTVQSIQPQVKHSHKLKVIVIAVLVLLLGSIIFYYGRNTLSQKIGVSDEDVRNNRFAQLLLAPELCAKINKNTVQEERGLDIEYKKYYFTSRCYSDLAVTLKDLQLCESVRSISLLSSDEKYSESHCKELVSKNTNEKIDRDDGSSLYYPLFFSDLEKIGYTKEDLQKRMGIQSSGDSFEDEFDISEFVRSKLSTYYINEMRAKFGLSALDRTTISKIDRPYLEQYMYLEDTLPHTQLVPIGMLEGYNYIPLSNGLYATPYGVTDNDKVRSIVARAFIAQEKGTLKIKLPKFEYFWINGYLVSLVDTMNEIYFGNTNTDYKKQQAKINGTFDIILYDGNQDIRDLIKS